MRDYFYAPENHYWRKADGGLFSSARAAYTTASDPQYIAWLAAGGTPTAFPRDTAGEESERELAEVLAAAGCMAAAAVLCPAVEAEKFLNDSDKGMARGVEDLYAAQLKKGLLSASDLPHDENGECPLLKRIEARQIAREIREGKK